MDERLATLPQRADVRKALRAAGLSDRQAKALLREGWQGIVGASEAEVQELRDRIADIQRGFST